MPTPETELILRSLDDLRDDLTGLRADTRSDFAIAFQRLDETRQLVARIDERTRPTVDEAAPSKRRRALDVVRQHGPAAGVSAVVVALLELVPELLKHVGGGG